LSFVAWIVKAHPRQKSTWSANRDRARVSRSSFQPVGIGTESVEPQGRRSGNVATILHVSAATATVIRRVFKAFQIRDYRVMWIGACASAFGTWMQKLAQSWLVYDISHSAPLLGLDAFLGGHPDSSCFP
jgi:hypothetical protein